MPLRVRLPCSSRRSPLDVLQEGEASLADSRWMGLVCFVLWALAAGAQAGTPVLGDPQIPHGELLVYRLIKEDGTTEESRQRVLHDRWEGEPVYVIRTESKRMVIRRRDLTPIRIEKFTEDGSLEWEIRYSKDRALFIYPGPTRNKVEEVDENRYDVNPIVHVVRGFPFGREEKVTFDLVTADRVVGVYLKVVGEERVEVPAGIFDCYKIEAGLTGLAGRVYRKKIYFWVEKTVPHRMIRQEDEGITDVRIVELAEYRVEPAVEGP